MLIEKRPPRTIYVCMYAYVFRKCPRALIHWTVQYFTTGPRPTTTAIALAPAQLSTSSVPRGVASSPGLTAIDGRPGTHCLRMRLIYPTSG